MSSSYVGLLYFFLMNLSVLCCARLIAESVYSDESFGFRWFVTVALFPVLVVASVLCVGSIGWLNAPSLSIIWSILGVAAVVAMHNSRRARVSMPGGRQLDDHPWGTRLGMVASAVVVLVIAADVLLGGVSFKPDDLSYHATAVAHWVGDGELSYAPYGYHAHFPFHADLISLWFVLPFGADGSAALSGLLWLILALGGIAVAGSRLEFPRWVIATLGLLLVSSARIRVQVSTFSAVDLAGATAAFSATVLVLAAYFRASDRPLGRCDFVISGALAGFALGCKISFAPVAAALALWIGLSNQGKAWRERAKDVLTFTLAAVAVGGYWYGRNLILTGNPLFPAEFSFFEGPFGAEMQSQTTFISRLFEDPLNIEHWKLLAATYLGWPGELGVLVGLGYISVVGWLAPRAWRMGERRRSVVLATLAAMGVGFALVFLFLPFSATDNSAQAVVRSAPRFVNYVFLVGLVLLGAMMTMLAEHKKAVAAVVAGVASACWLHVDELWWELALAACTAGPALWLGHRSMRSGLAQMRGAKELALVAVVLLLVAATHPVRQARTDQRLFTHGPSSTVGPGWGAVDRLPSGSTIGWYGPAAYEYYAMFGRRFQLVPVEFNRRGERASSYLSRWERGQLSWWSQDRSDVSREEFVSNMRQSQIDYIFVTKWRGNRWPGAYEWLSETGAAVNEYDDGYSAIFRINLR
jgi:hypothetical protein